MVWAITTNSKCSHCGLHHGFITWKHRIIVARNEEEKKLITPFVARRMDKLKLVQVDFKKFNLKTISVTEFAVLAGQTNG